MAKKPTAPKLQEDIQTDEELNEFLEKPGLLVLDIYSEWCGPCLGMATTLRKIKLDLGGDFLHFAICKADTIEVFKRFRRKSEPTWLFVTHHKAVNLLFGSDTPTLLGMITNELKRLKNMSRTFYELDEYQPEEAIRRQIKEDAINKALALEMEEKERKRLQYLNQVTDTIMDNLSDMGVTIFGPQVQRNNIKKILQRAEQLKIQCKDRNFMEISRADFETIHFDCPNPISDEILEQLEGKELLICFWKVLGSGPEVPIILQQLAKDLQTAHSVYGENDEEIVLSPLIEPMDIKIEEPIEGEEVFLNKFEENFFESQKSREDFAFEEYEEGEEEEMERIDDDENFQVTDFDFDLDFENLDENVFGESDMAEELPKRKTRTKKIRIPPIWVPDNHRTHAALIYTYFRLQTKTFLPPDPEPEPPYVVMAFDTHKKRDLVLHADRYKKDVPMYGFFTSDDADEAQYIANSLNKYKEVTANDKIVLKVRKATSHTMLNLVTYGPSYVSPNPVVGLNEAMKFFPPTYVTADQESEEEEKILKAQQSNQKHSKNKKMIKAQKSKDASESQYKIEENIAASASAGNIVTTDLQEDPSGFKITKEKSKEELESQHNISKNVADSGSAGNILTSDPKDPSSIKITAQNAAIAA